MQVLQAIQRGKRALSAWLEGVPLMPQVLINVRLATDAQWQDNTALASTRAAVERELGQRGRLLIRASGTEPLLRVMVEAVDAELAQRCAERLAQSVQV